MKKFLFNLVLMLALCVPWAHGQTLNEGFEGTSFPPDDWTSIHVSGADKSWARSTSDHHTGSACAYMNYGNSGVWTYNWLITPKLTPKSGESLSFYAKYGSSGTTNVYVKVSTTDAEPSSFTTLQNITSNITSSWSQISIDLSAYVGQNIYIGFYVEDNWGKNIFIDDVTGVSLFVPLCPKPTNLTVSNLTAFSADATWVAGGTESSWQYLYGQEGFTPDWSLATTTNTATASISGLNPNTSYDFLTRAYCSDADQSDPAKTSFRTACAAVLPTSLGTIGFETSEGFTTGSGNLNGNNCWHAGNAQSTNSSYIPYVYNSYAHTGSNCLKLYAYKYVSSYSPTNADGAYAVFPQFDVTTKGVNQYQVSFFARKESTGASYNDTIWVGVMTDPTDIATFTPVDYALVTSTTYEEFLLSLGSYTGSGTYVALRTNVNPNSTSSYKYGSFYVDDVTFSLIPACRPLQSVSVSDITRTSLRVNWQPYSGVTNCQGYQVLCSTSANPDLATETPIDVNSAATLFLDIDNLERDTTYYVYVRSNCGSEDGYSEWASTSATTKSLNECSNAVTVADGTVTNAYAPIYGYYYDVTGTQTQFVYPSDMLTALRGKSISKMTFYAAASSYSFGSAKIQVSVGITSSDNLSAGMVTSPSNIVYTGSVVVADGKNVIEFSTPFDYPLDGGNLLIEYKLTTTGSCPNTSFYGISTTDIMCQGNKSGASNQSFLPKVDFGYCETVEACPAVTDVTVSNVAQTTATISWTASMGDYANDYDVLLSTTPVTDFSSVSPQYTALTATTLNLTDLNSYTDYYAYVRVNCNAREHNDGEAWSEAATFKTLSNCVTPENLTATVLSKTTAKVEWDHFEGQAMNYRYILSTEEVANPDSETPTAINIDADSLILPLLEPATTYYFYLSNDCGSSDGFSPYISTSFTMPEACIAPTNVNLSNIQKYQMTLNWTPSPYADETDSYDIIVSNTEILDFTGTVPTYTGVSGDSLVLNTLQRNTTYYVYIRTNCGEDLVTDWSTAVSATTAPLPSGLDEMQIGTGTLTSSYHYPFSTWYHNSYTQQVYSKSEINHEPGSISNISFNYFWTNTTTRFVTVYMANVAEGASVSSGWINSGLTEVYSGKATTFSSTDGWCTLPLDNAFEYTGGDIVVAVYMQYNSCETQYNSTNRFYYSNGGSARYLTNDGTSATAISLNENHVPSSSSDANTYRPNIRFAFPFTTEACPTVDAPVASNVDVTAATLTWNEGQGDFASSYDVYFSDEEMSDPSAVVPIVTSLNTTTYNLTGLDPNTHYYAYVRVNCVNENYYDGSSLWSPAGEFTTELPCRRPTDFADTRIYAHAVDLTWVNVSNASAWQVGIVGTSDTSWQDVVNPTISNDTVSYHLTGLTASTPYHFLLRANCSASGEGFSAICLNEVNITTISDANAIIDFAVDANYPVGIQMEDAVIDTTNHTINVTVLAGTDLTTLVPYVFTTTSRVENPYKTVKINGAFYYDGAIDFSSPVVVTVYAEDTTLTQDWTITVQYEACATPTYLTINNVERRKMTLNWTLGDTTATNFDLVVSETEITDLTTATPKNITAVGNVGSYSYTIDSLFRNTQYYIYIRTNCGAEQSHWANASQKTPDICNEMQVTVANGTQTNSDVPVYGYNTDSPQRSQSIYPAAMLTDLVGKDISSMKYFVYSGGSMGSSSNWESKSFNVKLAVTNQENLSSSWATDDMTTVYNGTLSANTTNGMTITFDQPFAYNGGNLLVEFELPVKDGWSSCSFYGATVTGGSRNAYGSSYTTAAGTVQNFLPKVLFTSSVCDERCPAVDSAYAELTGEGLHTATVHWTASTGDYANTYDVIVSETEISVADLETRTPDYPAVNALSQDLSELDPYTIYYVYVRANCDGEGQNDGSSTWYGFNFRTNAACHVPHDLAAELTNTNAVEITWTNDQDNNFRYILSTTQVALENLEAAPKTGENLNATSVSFDNLAYETDYYFYLSNACGGSDGNSPWDSVSFTTLPQCNGVAGLVASDTAANSVRLTWSNGQFCNATSWQVTATDASDNVVYDRVATDTTTLVFGLAPETAYTLAVRAICGAGDIAAAATATITTTAAPAACVTVADGTSESYYAPVYSLYCDAKNRVQSLYPASMLAELQGRTINSVKFFVSDQGTPSNAGKWDNSTFYVKMATTSQENLSSAWVTDAATTVYTGTLQTSAANGMEVVFDAPFAYDGGNLMIEFEQPNASDYTSTYFYGQDYTGGARYAQGGSYATSSGTPTNFLPKAQFCFAASGCNKVANIVAENVTVNSADISWTPGGSETSWNVYNSATELDADDLAALTDADYTTVDYPAQALSGLNVDADYYYYVRAICSATDTSDWQVFHFITLPSCSAPLTAVASNDAPDTLTFAVSAGQYGTPESYNYEYWTIGTTAAENGDTVAFVGTDTVAVAVAPFQTYGWRVKANCGTSDGSSRWTDGNPVYVCGVFHVTDSTPFVDGCGDAPTVLNCWSTYSTAGVSNYWSLSSSIKHTGDAAFTSTYYGDSYLYSPLMGLPADRVELSFWSYNDYPGDYGKNYVLVYNADLTEADTIWSPESVTKSWVETKLYLDEYAGQQVKLAFLFVGNNAHRWILDDVKVSVVPAYEVVSTSTNEAYGTVAIAGDTNTEGKYYAFDTVTLTATAVDHYHFHHWTTGDDTISIVNPLSFVPTKDTVLNAVFAIDTFTVTLAVNDTTLGTVDGDSVYTYGSTATLTAEAIDHYHFRDWTDTSANVVSTGNPATITVECDTMLIANFAIDTHRLALSVMPLSVMGTVADVNGYYNYGDSVNISATPNYGYFFTGWSDNDTVNERRIAILSDTAIAAQFDSLSYNITALTADAVMGTVTGSATQKYLTTATIEATPTYGYHFVAWNDGSTINPRSFIVERDTTFTATFDSNIYNINVVSADVVMGEVTGSTAQKYLTTATIEALPNYGYYFTQWNDGNTDNPRTINVLRDSTFTASFDSNTYTITVESADVVMGTVTGSADQKYLTTATIEATPTYGYHFVAWNDGNTDNPRTFIVESDTSFTASFDSNIYKVTILADLDEEGQPKGDVSGSGSFKYLSQVPISVEQRLGFYFLNWSDGDVDAHRTITVTKDTTITAMFSIQPVWIVATSCDTVMGSVTPRQNILDSLSATISATAKYGYHFVSWNDGVTDNPRTLQVVSDTAFSALFDYNQYDITVASANPVMGSVAGTATKNYLAVDTISATSNYGYHFTQWNDGNTDNPRYVTVQRDSLFTASFDNNTYSVAVLHDTVMGTIENVGEHRYLDNVTLTAVPKVGYHLDHWDNGSENADRSFVITCDTSFTFTFAPNVYDLSVSADNDVKGSVSGSGTYNYNTNASIAAVANYGYEFHGWNDGINANPRTVNVVSDTNFVALFDTVDFTITALAAVSTMGSVEGSGNYAYLSSATLTATPNYGYHFTQWSDGSTVNPRTFTVTCDSSFTAQFAANTYNLTLLADEVMGSVTGAGDFEYNASTIISASANYGYHFTGWSDGVSLNPRMITVTMDSTITALFAANAYHVAASVNIDEAGYVTGAADYQFLDQATLTATATPCYHFVGWNDGVVDNPRTIVVESDTAFTALFELNVYESEFTEVACDSYSWDNDVYTISGDYQHVYSTVNGCDSTVTLHLTVNYSDEGEFSDQASDLYVWDGREYTESGDYTFVYQNVYGCDSTMTLHLTIANFPTPLISQVNNRSLMVNHYPYGNNEYVDYADYRWYRNGELVASGSDNYLEASGLLNGCYTLEVPVNADKSVWVYSNELCFQNGVLVGIEDADAIEISFTVAPNPVAKGAMMTISTELPEHMLQGATLTMFDLSGRIITSMPMTQQSVSMTADQASGVYMIQIMTRSGEKQVKKVIVR